MPFITDTFAESWGVGGMNLSYERLLHETDSRPITCIVSQRQLRLYGHVARYPYVDHAHRVVSVGDHPEWRRPRGRPHSSWLNQVDVSCQEELSMGKGPAWRLAQNDPREYRRRVGEATRSSAYGSNDRLNIEIG